VPARILTVYREGGDYKPEHVERIRAQCEKHAPGVEFLCLQGDLLYEGWPGWWAKMSLFRYHGPILYMDLDTAIVGDLAPLLAEVENHEFIALRNPLPTPSRFGSGLMGWAGDMSHIYCRFRQDAPRHMARCNTRELWGDQGFISEDYPNPVFWQDLFPGEILSWKVDCKMGVPEAARVVYFHGLPRPWEVGV
jgi:hypothetical protein